MKCKCIHVVMAFCVGLSAKLAKASMAFSQRSSNVAGLGSQASFEVVKERAQAR